LKKGEFEGGFTKGTSSTAEAKREKIEKE